MADQETHLDWIESLARARDPEERQPLLSRVAEGDRRELSQRLCREVVRLARRDLRRAENLVLGLHAVVEGTDDPYLEAQASKADGHLHYLGSRYEEALASYRRAQTLFEASGHPLEAAMNRSSGALQVLILLGRYDEALAEIEAARPIVVHHGGPVQEARLLSNKGNVFFRRDQFRAALDCYEDALASFRVVGEPQDLVVALANVGVTRTALDDFNGALEVYEELRRLCRDQDLPLAEAQADYNMAYGYFLRGRFSMAIELYRRSRKLAERVGDPYHQALCDLDQGEIYLELQLHRECRDLLQRAFERFEELGLTYEAAKASVFLAVAAYRRGDEEEARERLAEGRIRFSIESNEAWLALIDFHTAVLLAKRRSYSEARRLIGPASAFFDESGQPARKALCRLLEARILLELGKATEAREACREAIVSLEELDLPHLGFRAAALLGQTEEALGDPEEALAAYRRANRLAEDLRSHLRSEESGISFLRGKLWVYESLVALLLADSPDPSARRDAFRHIEQAKSRVLAGLIESRAAILRPRRVLGRAAAERVGKIRETLNATYRRIARERLRTDRTDELARLEKRCRELESDLSTALAHLRVRDRDFAELQGAVSVDVAKIQRAIPAETRLVEYYEARDWLYGCVLDGQSIEIRRLAPAPGVHQALRSLRFNLHRFRWSELPEEAAKTAERALLRVLRQLYDSLVGPLVDLLTTQHLIVVPHGQLHQLPFHALWDGEQFLIDRYLVTYAPSASILAGLGTAPARPESGSLVIGVADPAAPEIEQEARAVAACLPGARLLVGKEATQARVRELAPECGFLHLATHGYFRRDNPMFSALQLGDSRLVLLDLYDLELNAELVVLSGCGTGLSVVENGDELIGLSRGLLYAGARSVMATLWDVNDQSTSLFMRCFYSRLQEGSGRSLALREAAQELRQTHRSPYFWAPFILIGDPGISTSPVAHSIAAEANDTPDTSGLEPPLESRNEQHTRPTRQGSQDPRGGDRADRHRGFGVLGVQARNQRFPHPDPAG